MDFSALFPSANPETSSSSDDAATKAAAKVDAAKAQEKEMVDAQGGKEHLTLGGNPSKVPEGSAPRSSKVEKEEEGGEPKLGKCK